MLVTGCSMLVGDPVLARIEKNIPYSIQYPETNIQHHVLNADNCVLFTKLSSKLKILLYKNFYYGNLN